MKCNLFRHGCKIWKHVETYQKAWRPVNIQRSGRRGKVSLGILKYRQWIVLEIEKISGLPKRFHPSILSLSSDGLSSSHTNSATNNGDQLLRSVALGKISWLASICVFIVSQKGHTKNGWCKNHAKIQIIYFFFWDLCSLISTPLFLYIQDINHRFPALRFISDRISFSRLFSKRCFFPFRKLSPAVTSNSQWYNKSRDPAWRQPTYVRTEWISHPNVAVFFEFFFHKKNGTLVRKNLAVFGRYISIDLFGVFFFGNPPKGKKMMFFVRVVQSSPALMPGWRRMNLAMRR